MLGPLSAKRSGDEMSIVRGVPALSPRHDMILHISLALC
jgi:hypothetical protein